MDTYHVMLGQQAVGEATVGKEGLYYVFCCTVSLDHRGIYRLILETEKGRTDLGILVPHKGSFCLKKRLPAKQIHDGEFTFYIINNNEERQECLAQVRGDQPFAHIDKLPGARLRLSGGKTEILFQSN